MQGNYFCILGVGKDTLRYCFNLPPPITAASVDVMLQPDGD